MGKYLIGLFFIIGFMTACSGGGGGGASPSIGGGTISGCMDPAATNYNSNATVSDGSCSYSGGGGGSGTAAYYGFASDSTTMISGVSEASVIAGATDLIKITNQFALNVRNATTRAMDIAIFQPTCVGGVLENKYAAIQVSGANNQSTVVQLTQTASGLKIQRRAATETVTSGPLFPFKLGDEGVATTLAGTCNETTGVLDLGASGKVVSNGKMLVYRTAAGDIFVGIHESSITTSLDNMKSKVYNRYGNLNGAYGVADSSGVNAITNNNGLSSTNTNIKDVLNSTYELKITSDDTAVTQVLAVKHTVMYLESAGTGGSQEFAYGVASSNVGGKAIYLGVLPQSTSTGSAALNPSGTGIQLKGSQNFEILVEQ